MSDGDDIRQLEEQLWNWNYMKEYPTDHFDDATTRAIRALQKALGVERTGRLEVGDIEFVTGRFVVSSHSAAIGDRLAGSPIYETERKTVSITVDLPVGSSLAKAGNSVDVVLPNGSRTKGKVDRVEPASEDDDGAAIIPTVIALEDPAALGSVTGGSVTVDFVSNIRNNVLSVPVLALGARGDGGFEVELVQKDGSTEAVRVETGLFSGDLVEITGKGIAEGDRVVVPE